MEYFKAYFTRAPCRCDPALIVRFKGGDANDMTKRVEEAEESARLTTQVVKDMKKDAAELKKSVDRLQRTTRSRTEEEKSKGKGKLKCFRCGGNHLVKDCSEEDTRTDKEKGDAGSDSN